MAFGWIVLTTAFGVSLLAGPRTGPGKFLQSSWAFWFGLELYRAIQSAV